jgi:hypothetical protein
MRTIHGAIENVEAKVNHLGKERKVLEKGENLCPDFNVLGVYLRGAGDTQGARL